MEQLYLDDLPEGKKITVTEFDGENRPIVRFVGGSDTTFVLLKVEALNLMVDRTYDVGPGYGKCEAKALTHSNR